MYVVSWIEFCQGLLVIEGTCIVLKALLDIMVLLFIVILASA